jgi:predicted HAD superfamily phosphohydrolase YqeG
LFEIVKIKNYIGNHLLQKYRMSIETNREGLNFTKTSFFFKSLLGKTRAADAYLERFTDFDPEQLQTQTRKVIKAILLDIDACIAPIYQDILPENIEKIKNLLADGFAVAIYSNCTDLERLKPLHDIGIPVYKGSIPKPDPQGFLDACANFGFDPKKTWMIGDNPSTDGGAIGTLGGMVIIKPIPDGDISHLPLKKRAIIQMRNILRSMVLCSTLINNKSIIRN